METTFSLGESSEDVLENVCFMVLRIKKRGANTKAGATFTSFWFIIDVTDIIYVLQSKPTFRTFA